MTTKFSEGNIYEIEVSFVDDELDAPLPESYTGKHKIIKLGDTTEGGSVLAQCVDCKTDEKISLLLKVKNNKIIGLT
ncbi:hypothetical protein KAJ61_02440 [Candidatus Parcubacteria bacterium]|nr:hypothetical protein [Candidatus Parcubacteria bacterium]